MWEGGLRVPFVARWPGKIPAGRVSDEFLTTLELLPTLAAAAGAEPPAGRDARRLRHAAHARRQAPSPRKEMFWEFRGQKAARVGNYKWLEAEQGRGLYDLTSDLGEKNDLTDENARQWPLTSAARWTAWRTANGRKPSRAGRFGITRFSHRGTEDTHEKHAY